VAKYEENVDEELAAVSKDMEKELSALGA